MTKTELTKYEKAILLFYLKGFLSDISKALIFFFIFYALGFHKELLWGVFFLIIFRIYSGGLHCKTYFKCFLLSFVILSSGIFFGSNLYLSKYLMIILSTICGVVTCILCPVLAPTRPAPTKAAIKNSKFKEGLIIGTFVLVLMLVQINSIINIGFWLLVIHTIQLYVAYTRR